MLVEGMHLSKVPEGHKCLYSSKKSQGNPTSNNADNVPLHGTVITSCHLFQFRDSFLECVISNEHPDENEAVVDFCIAQSNNTLV